MRVTESTAFALLVAGVAALGTATATAQQRPALTEDPNPIPEGKMVLEMGFDHAWDQAFPVSGLEGNLLRAPLVGFTTSVGPAAEISIEGVTWNWLRIHNRFAAPFSDVVSAQGDRTSSFGDLVVGTKVRLVGETEKRPAIGLHFATHLPNAGNEKGIGLDTMDFFQSVLVGKSIRSTRLIGNIGIAILSDPTRGDNQNDVITYGFSFIQTIKRYAIVFDLNGWVSTRITVPPGTDTRGTTTFGFRYTRGNLRFDAGLFNGFKGDDGRTGIMGGLTWTFDNFLNPRKPDDDKG